MALPRFRDYVGDAVILAHNAAFDLLALQPPGAGIELDMPVLDTLLISRALDASLDGHDLDTLAERYDLAFPPGTRHTALGDARVTAELWLSLLPRLRRPRRHRYPGEGAGPAEQRPQQGGRLRLMTATTDPRSGPC